MSEVGNEKVEVGVTDRFSSEGKQKLLQSLVAPIEFSFSEDERKFETITGFDKGEGIQRNTFLFLRIDENWSSAGFKLISKDKEEIQVDAGDWVAIKGGETLFFGEKQYVTYKGPWEDFCFQEIKKEPEVDKKSKELFQKVIRVWTEALKGDEQFSEFLKANFDTALVEEVYGTVKYLKEHPIFQEFDMVGKIDLREILNCSSEEEIRGYLKNQRLDRLLESPESTTIANGSGKYFFNLFPTTAKFVSSLLNHERVHILQETAEKLVIN